MLVVAVLEKLLDDVAELAVLCEWLCEGLLPILKHGCCVDVGGINGLACLLDRSGQFRVGVALKQTEAVEDATEVSFIGAQVRPPLDKSSVYFLQGAREVRGELLGEGL